MTFKITKEQAKNCPSIRRGGKRKGAGRPSKYGTKTKDVTLTWPPQAIGEAKKRASREEKTLSEYILLKLFGRKFHK